MPTNWRDEVQAELSTARKAAGNQMAGRSRVAARRAAGIAVSEFNRLTAFTRSSNNYYTLLLAFSNHPGIPEDIQRIALRLCQRVDEQYSLPEGSDLIKDAEDLMNFVDGYTTLS